MMDVRTYKECLCCQEIAPISEKKIKCITEYDGYWGNYLNIEVCMDLLTEMDPLMAMNQYMTYNCTCKMQIKLRHYILCCDCEVTKFTCRNTRYPGTFAMFYKWDTLANRILQTGLSWPVHSLTQI